MTIVYNMLKMKKMNGLKIFALVLLSLSKFETMFGMEENKNEDEINDEYVNKNYYLIDDLGHKITLDNGEDIKFKIYSEEEIDEISVDENKDILKISEDKDDKILVITMKDENNKEKTYLTPIPYMNEEVPICHKEKDNLVLWGFTLEEKDRKKYEKNTINCWLVKKIGENSINDDYILVDTENNKIEKINGKNILFKLLTRKEFLELKEKINKPENFLKNDEGKYILDNSQKPLFFEKKEEDLILYVTRIKDNLCLAWLLSLETTINFNKNNSIEVRMAKREEIDKIEEKKVEIDKIDKKEGEKFKEEDEEDDSSKCCCGIC